MLKGKRRDDKSYLRIVSMVALGLFLLCFVSIVVKFFYLTFWKGDYYEKKKEKLCRTVIVPAERGNIYSRDGRLMASTMPRYRLVIDPSYIKDEVYSRDIKALCVKLSEFFGDKSASEYKKMIDNKRFAGKQYLVVNNKWLTHEEYSKVRKFPILCEHKRNPLIDTKVFQREFFFGSLARRTIGKLTEDTATNMMRGVNGLEHAYDSYLKGTNGSGIRVRTLNTNVNFIDDEPEDGYDLVTTIDVDLQDVAEYSLRKQLEHQQADKGVAMIMEVKTGAIRAIVNLKRNDNNEYVEDYFNYAIGEAIEPGSTFKLATIMACMEDEYVVPSDTVNTFKGAWRIHDRTMKDSHTGGFGLLNVDMAFAKSSNIAFARMMEKYYAMTPQKFIDRLYEFGLCDDLNIDLEGAKSTVMTKPSDKTWSGTSLHWLSTGYGVLMTPLQMLTFYNAVANEGKMMKPQFAEAIMDGERVVKYIKPEVLRSSIASQKTIRQAHEMLKLVVEKGTAQKVKDASCQIAGKTGTAQIAEGSQGYGHASNSVKHLASFAGFFPADNPMYTCIVMVYKPKLNIYGSEVSAMVVKDIANRVYAKEYARGMIDEEPKIEKTDVFPYSKGGKVSDMEVVFDELNIESNFKSINEATAWVSTFAKEDGIELKKRSFVPDMVPNLIGMGASDAVSLLEQMGLRVRLIGYGSVKRQSLKPGSSFKKGQTIEIELRNG